MTTKPLTMPRIAECTSEELLQELNRRAKTLVVYFDNGRDRPRARAKGYTALGYALTVLDRSLKREKRPEHKAFIRSTIQSLL